MESFLAGVAVRRGGVHSTPPPSRTEWTRRVPQPVLIGRGVSDYPGAHAGRRVQVHFPVRDGRRSGDAYVELEGEAEVYAP